MLNQAGIEGALERAGLHPPCHLMVHASLSALGVVDGGADAVVQALQATAGPDGAVVCPSFRDAIRSDHYALTQCRDCGRKDLCPSREAGCTGIVGERIREQAGSVRSCHPTHSWVGVGGSAPFLLEGHRQSLTPCGTESPFLRLMERDGWILLLGVAVNSFTNIHAVEDARNVPYLSAIDPPRRHATYTTSGRRLQYVYPELLHAALREAGLLRSVRVGSGLAHVPSARGVGAFLWVITEDDPWCLVLRPFGNEYRPFEDACSKVARMTRAWRKTPEIGAWKLLLKRSRGERVPVMFKPGDVPATRCPAYQGVVRGSHRCAANDLPPWERFEDFPPLEPGVATCDDCNWPAMDRVGE